jgi:hypothetical protein
MKRIKPFIQALTTVVFTFSMGMFVHAEEPKHNYSGNALDFEAQPAHSSSVDPQISSYFYEKGKPGDTLSETLILHNPNSYPITIKPSVVKATTGINGGIAYENQPSTTTWIRGLEKEVTLAPNTSQNISFQIEIPPNTGPGDYIEGISLVDHPPSKNESSVGKSKVSVEIKQQIRRVVAVELSIAGTVTPRLNWMTPKVVNEPSGSSLLIRGMNLHQVLLHEISGNLSLLKDGKTIWKIPLSNITLAPNSPFRFKYRWQEGHPEPGTYTVHLDITGSQIGRLQKDLLLEISVDTLKQYQKLTGHSAVEPYIPQWVYWVIGGSLFLLLGCIFFLLRVFRKMKNQQNSGNPQS